MDPGSQQQSRLAAVLQALAALTPESSEQSRYRAGPGSFISQVPSNVQSEYASFNVPTQQPQQGVSQLLGSLISPPVAKPCTQREIRLLEPDRTRDLRPTRSSVTSGPGDPSSIIDWSSGLRYVSKLASQNPSFATSIQKVS
jgi:hypothetical protein